MNLLVLGGPMFLSGHAAVLGERAAARAVATQTPERGAECPATPRP